jgi:transcriptional antiterminator RfaH
MPAEYPSSPVLPESAAWYCLRSRTKAEHLAAAQLVQLDDVQVFCPRLRFRRSTRRGRVWFTEALFPGYVFAFFSPRTQFRAVVHSPGITGIVAFGDLLVPVPTADIESLRSLVDADGIKEIAGEIEEGRETEVVSGPFRGLQVVVSRVLPSKDRVRILMEFLGGMREIEVGLEQLASPRPQAREFTRESP